MKRSVRRALVICVVVLLAAGWIWRYTALNSFYAGLYEQSRCTYPPGEIVPFGDDRTEMGVIADGYSIRLDGFEIMELSDFLSSISVPADSVYTNPDKVAVAYATLFNEGSEAPGITLTDFTLHGVDNYANIDWELVTVSNPVLTNTGSYGISLSPGTEYEIILPFALNAPYFGTDTWRHIEQYDFYLHVADYPTEKDIMCD